MDKNKKNPEMEKRPLSDEQLKNVNGGVDFLIIGDPISNPYKNPTDRDKRDGQNTRPFG